jgi:hypothetical protein
MSAAASRLFDGLEPEQTWASPGCAGIPLDFRAQAEVLAESQDEAVQVEEVELGPQRPFRFFGFRNLESCHSGRWESTQAPEAAEAELELPAEGYLDRRSTVDSIVVSVSRFGSSLTTVVVEVGRTMTALQPQCDRSLTPR